MGHICLRVNIDIYQWQTVPYRELIKQSNFVHTHIVDQNANIFWQVAVQQALELLYRLLCRKLRKVIDDCLSHDLKFFSDFLCYLRKLSLITRHKDDIKTWSSKLSRVLFSKAIWRSGYEGVSTSISLIQVFSRKYTVLYEALQCFSCELGQL